jgi:hypothetical protein
LPGFASDSRGDQHVQKVGKVMTTSNKGNQDSNNNSEKKCVKKGEGTQQKQNLPPTYKKILHEGIPLHKSRNQEVVYISVHEYTSSTKMVETMTEIRVFFICFLLLRSLKTLLLLF